MSHIVIAKCVYECWESKSAMKFYRGDEAHIDLADPYQRKLAWIKTPMGQWAMEFDRAASSNPFVRIWFCKDCGQPFEKFSDMGTHVNAEHGNQAKREVAEALDFEEAQKEERLVAQLRQSEIDAQLARANAAIAKLTKEKEALGFVEPANEVIPEEEVAHAEKRGRTFTCKTCGESQPNLWALRTHNAAHKAAAEVQPVTA